MDTAASAPSDLPRQSGFNLIEAAIVLGVVGLVIGGIWIAAASVSMKMNTNAEAQSVLSIVQGMRQLYGPESYPSAEGGQNWEMSNLIAAKIVPPTDVDGSGNLVTKWGGNTVMGILTQKSSSDFAPQGYGILITFQHLNLDQCIGIATAVAGRASNNDMAALAIGGASFIRSFPADISTIISNCTTQVASGYVGFYFRP